MSKSRLEQKRELEISIAKRTMEVQKLEKQQWELESKIRIDKLMRDIKQGCEKECSEELERRRKAFVAAKEWSDRWIGPVWDNSDLQRKSLSDLKQAKSSHEIYQKIARDGQDEIRKLQLEIALRILDLNVVNKELALAKFQLESVRLPYDAILEEERKAEEARESLRKAKANEELSEMNRKLINLGDIAYGIVKIHEECVPEIRTEYQSIVKRVSSLEEEIDFQVWVKKTALNGEFLNLPSAPGGVTRENVCALNNHLLKKIEVELIGLIENYQRHCKKYQDEVTHPLKETVDGVNQLASVVVSLRIDDLKETQAFKERISAINTMANIVSPFPIKEFEKESAAILRYLNIVLKMDVEDRSGAAAAAPALPPVPPLPPAHPPVVHNILYVNAGGGSDQAEETRKRRHAEEEERRRRDEAFYRALEGHLRRVYREEKIRKEKAEKERIERARIEAIEEDRRRTLQWEMDIERARQEHAQREREQEELRIKRINERRVVRYV